jgi:hypothetical protein
MREFESRHKGPIRRNQTLFGTKGLAGRTGPLCRDPACPGRLLRHRAFPGGPWGPAPAGGGYRVCRAVGAGSWVHLVGAAMVHQQAVVHPAELLRCRVRRRAVRRRRDSAVCGAVCGMLYAAGPRRGAAQVPYPLPLATAVPLAHKCRTPGVWRLCVRHQAAHASAACATRRRAVRFAQRPRGLEPEEAPALPGCRLRLLLPLPDQVLELTQQSTVRVPCMQTALRHSVARALWRGSPQSVDPAAQAGRGGRQQTRLPGGAR